MEIAFLGFFASGTHRPTAREVAIAKLPDCPEVQLFSFENDLATGFVPPVFKEASYIHPTDRFVAATFLGLAYHQVDVNWLARPIFEMCFVFDVEDFFAIPLTTAQIGIAALELDVNFAAARPTVVALKFQLAVDSVVKTSLQGGKFGWPRRRPPLCGQSGSAPGLENLVSA